MNKPYVLNPLKIGLMTAAIGLASCASTPLQLPTESDISQAQQTGTLEKMYSDLRLRSKVDPSAAKLSKRIGAMIADQKIAAATAELESAKVGGAIPTALLNAKTTLVTLLGNFNVEKANEFSALLSNESKNTQSVVKAGNAVLTSAESTLAEKLEAAQTVFGLRGESPAATEQRLLQNAYNVANNYEVEDDYEMASEKWAELLAAAPDFKDVSSRYEAVSGTFKLDQFNAMMNEGNVDGATAFYADLAAKSADMSDFESGGQQLLAYYQLQIETALEDEDFTAAINAADQIALLKQAGVTNYASDIVGTLAEALVLRAELYASQDEWGLAMGVLLAADSLMPNDPLVTEMFGKVNDVVFDKTITRLNIGAFTASGEYAQIGNRISSIVKENMLSAQLGSIKLIERESLEAVFVEKELQALKGATVNTVVEPADIVVQGEVTAASVDENRSAKRKTKRVITDIEKTPNPAYQEWLGLKESKRAKVAKPEEFFTKDIKEDVKISSEHIKLEGLLSVSYRLINPETAAIMKFSSLDETLIFEGENIDGVEIGMFVQESKVADLPSESKVMSNLAEVAAKRLSEELLAQFSQPVALFESEAAAFLTKDDEGAAALSLAKAYSYLLNQGEKDDTLGRQLSDLALSSDAFLEN